MIVEFPSAEQAVKKGRMGQREKNERGTRIAGGEIKNEKERETERKKCRPTSETSKEGNAYQ